MTIKEKVEKLVKKYETRNPFILVKDLGISLYYKPLGQLEGFYTVILKKRVVVLNENLDENRKKLILAHELAHDQLHRKVRKNLSEFLTSHHFFEASNAYEIEANIFAAHLLIEDGALNALLKEGYTLKEVAKILEVDYNLMKIKARELKKEGVFINLPSYESQNFL